MQPLHKHPAVQLGLYALTSALLLAGLHAATRNTIAENQRRHNLALLAQVLPLGDQAPVLETALLSEGEQPVWRLYKDNSVIAAALPVTATGGYSGDIELLIGIDQQHKLTGVRVTHHRETPGLGDEIDARRGPWIEQFKGLSLSNPSSEHWAVKKDGGYFDQFTGATITPRAVINGIRDTLALSDADYDTLFSPAPSETAGEQP